MWHERKKKRELTSVRLQKLLYFIQLAHLRHYGVPCFYEEFEAWEFGPVIRDLYIKYNPFPLDDITFHVKLQDKTMDSVSIGQGRKSLISNTLEKASECTTEELVAISKQQDPYIYAYAKGPKSVIGMESMIRFLREG